MENINIKTIAIDIDGTLLDSDHKILPKTKKALLEIQDKGIQLILISGRPTRSMLSIVEELELSKHSGVIVSNNGSMGYDVANEKVIYDTPIDKELVKEILASFKGKNIRPMVEKGEHLIVFDVYNGLIELNGKIINVMELEARAGDFLLREESDIDAFVQDRVNKILTIVDTKMIDTTIKEYRGLFGSRIHVVQSSPYYMEFVRPEVNKAYGLERLGIDKNTLMTFGDSMNDLEMLKFSKYPIAMGNAQEAVKEAAFYVTKDNDDEGIYEALKHFHLI